MKVVTTEILFDETKPHRATGNRTGTARFENELTMFVKVAETGVRTEKDDRRGIRRTNQEGRGDLR